VSDEGRRFALDKAQTEKYRAWLDDPNGHGKCKIHTARTAIGGGITFSFTPTTIGLGVRASCCVCKEEIDLSDYENW
jgi:hypothetical protein